jgi:hypothetical protein
VRFYSTVLFGTVISTALFAAAPVGSVSSMGPVEVSGTTMNASTVSSWPLVAGDVIATGNIPAVVFLTGKGRVTLAANSRVSLEKQGDQLSVRLLGGELNYDLLPASGLLFFNGSRAVTPAQAVATPVQGTVAAPNAPAHSTSPLPFATAQATARPKPSIVGP